MIKYIHDLEYSNKQYEFNTEINNYLGILSLSNNDNSNPMWGYYASDHKGFMIEINKSGINYLIENSHFFIFEPVIYDTKRPEVYLDEKTEIDEEVKKIFLTKSKEWAHEDEYRLVSKLSKDNYLEDDRNGIPIHCITLKKEHISSIVIGANADPSLREEIINWRNSYAPNVKTKKAWASETKFKLEYKNAI